jgi:anti-anti-sigma factor
MTREGKTNPDLEVLQPRRGTAVVVLKGEHDLSTKDRLHATFASLLETNNIIVADVSSVVFIDSSTLGVLAWVHRTVSRSGKEFRLQVGTEPIVKRVLEISGLLKVFDSYPTRDAAIDGSQIKQPDRLL